MTGRSKKRLTNGWNCPTVENVATTKDHQGDNEMTEDELYDHECKRGETWDEYDARGLYLCRVCDKCAKAKLAGYRQDVLTNSNYWHDEPIEEDY